jgi:tRNA A37 threonylcarbamoyladenosine synthetase subunit TsaC/SUA5/YrdC
MDPKLIYLMQTDTTVGLLSQDASNLANIKKRNFNKFFIKAYSSLKALRYDIRVQKKSRKVVRRSQKTTFIGGRKLESFRVIKDPSHCEFVSKFDWLYTTSANESAKEFDLEFAMENSDIAVLDTNCFEAKKPSEILKLLKKKMKKIRG